MWIMPGQTPGDLWPTFLHSLWTVFLPTGTRSGCPPAAHRRRPVAHSSGPLLHIAVHCSATKHDCSPCRVKGVTSRLPRTLWGTAEKLGTTLGRSRGALCTACAELSAVHRATGLSTVGAHRAGGQKSGLDLRKRRYPRNPQALLLLTPGVTWESASKWVLCTTRRRTGPGRLSRLDPEQHRVSVPYVRLVPGNLTLPMAE